MMKTAESLSTPCLTIVMVIVIIMSVFHPYPYDNVVTRWALTRQLAAEGTLRIDRFASLTNDRAEFEGHFYCDKAVLGSFVGAVLYAPLRAIGLGGPPGSMPIGGAGRYLIERILCGGSLLGLLLLLRQYLESRSLPADLPVLALGLGSILLPYSTLLYGHVPAAMLIFASYLFADRGQWLMADIAGALAAAFEFPVALLYVILLLYRRKSYWSPWRIFRIPLLLMCAFLPQIIHNWIAFGSPLTMGYSLETAEAFEGMSEGLFGFTYPKLRYLYMLVLSPERGLLFYMPWIGLGMAGFFVGGKRFFGQLKENPLPVCIVAYVVLFSAYYMPTGGWAFGPRHLIPIVPFAAVGIGRFVKGAPGRAFAAWLLLLPAILQALAGTLGEPHLPVHPVEQPIPLPQLNISLAMLFDGHHAMWLLGPVGAAGTVVLALLLWAFGGRSGFRVTTWGAACLLAWAMLMLLSSSGWGCKISFYRGIMAQHRGEYRLAVRYYDDALQDPGAPHEHIRSRMEYCRQFDSSLKSERTHLPAPIP